MRKSYAIKSTILQGLRHETLRMVLDMDDYESAKVALSKRRWRALHSRLESFKEFASEVIKSSLKYGFSNARIEATNNKSS